MELPALLCDALERDRVLAHHHDVKFSVVSRTTGSEPPRGPPHRHGTFDRPADAVALGRSLSGRDVTVLADGSGPYWSTAAPDEVLSQILEMVCRDKVMGPEEAAREHQREYWRDAIERLQAEQRLAEAVDLVRGCEDSDEAEQRLETEPFSLSRTQASHLVMNRNLRLLTMKGQREVQSELDDALRALDNLDSDSLDSE